MMDSRNLFSLEGKTALVTGAAYGIGFAIAEALSGAGARIAFNVRSRDLLAGCGLDDCVLKNGPEDFTFRQDFEEPDRLLSQMRERSFSYLQSICDRARSIHENTNL